MQSGQVLPKQQSLSKPNLKRQPQNRSRNLLKTEAAISLKTEAAISLKIEAAIKNSVLQVVPSSQLSKELVISKPFQLSTGLKIHTILTALLNSEPPINLSPLISPIDV